MKKLFILLLISASCFAEDISPSRQKELRELLKNDCGACHGLTLKGGMGTPLLAENLVNKSDTFLINTILNGRKGTAMPAWKSFINEHEATWLVQQLKK